MLQASKGGFCYAGLDLGATRDLTALVRVFADDDGGFDVIPSFFLPGDDLAEREDQDKAPYPRWRDEGHLVAMPGRTCDPSFVAREIARLHGEHRIEALAFDRWRIEDLKRELSAIGSDVELVPWGQGFKDMAPAIDLLERLVIDAKLRHGGQPVLTWCVLNAKTVADAAGNRKLDKQKSTGRIDGVVALGMALGLATRRGGEGVWEPMVEFL